LAAGGGSLLEVDYRIKPTAAVGPVLIDLRQVSLNEGGLVLTPTLVAGPDPTDGVITIVSAPGAATLGLFVSSRQRAPWTCVDRARLATRSS
jgi:hypothetical protein